MLPLEFLAYVLYMKAIKRSPLSLTLPFLALTPVFLIISGKIILHEDINPIGLSGILLIVFGAYALHAGTSRLGIFEPFRAIFKERGSIYMIIVAFIYSITSACGKFAIKQSSPLFFGATYDPLLGFLFIPVVCIRYSRGALNLSLLKSHKWQFLLLAIVFSLSVITHCIGISMANAAYMISIKRLSMVFAVFYGHILFKEKEIANRLIGTSLMFAGAVLIAFA
jgi:drug/metabolite transporter (DMT)-like permease